MTDKEILEYLIEHNGNCENNDNFCCFSPCPVYSGSCANDEDILSNAKKLLEKAIGERSMKVVKREVLLEEIRTLKIRLIIKQKELDILDLIEDIDKYEKSINEPNQKVT